MPQPHDVLEVSSGEVRAFQLLQPHLGQRMETAPEQRAHLLRRDRVADVQTVDSRHAGTDPHPGRLAAFGVVRGEPSVPLVGRVQGRDLPGQVVITGPGGELVQTHRHVSLSPVTSAQWSPPGGYIPAVHQVCPTRALRVGGGTSDAGAGRLNHQRTSISSGSVVGAR